ncbi:hypothetical protein CDEST_00773 [Colletotrichum destructivum]|uniref:Uncharacterized protein n=1 Tax=Colletotrichum destructivum TaxID=34406 RepID=A0AAX4HYG6_9PEZI|nr:hypothetical protein CDEST_00773 [Colletotrichum destructivum]
MATIAERMSLLMVQEYIKRICRYSLDDTRSVSAACWGSRWRINQEINVGASTCQLVCEPCVHYAFAIEGKRQRVLQGWVIPNSKHTCWTPRLPEQVLLLYLHFFDICPRKTWKARDPKVSTE